METHETRDVPEGREEQHSNPSTTKAAMLREHSQTLGGNGRILSHSENREEMNLRNSVKQTGAFETEAQE